MGSLGWTFKHTHTLKVTRHCPLIFTELRDRSSLLLFFKMPIITISLIQYYIIPSQMYYYKASSLLYCELGITQHTVFFLALLNKNARYSRIFAIACMIITNDIGLVLFQFQVLVTLREIPSIMIMFTYPPKTVSSVCVKATSLLPRQRWFSICALCQAKCALAVCQAMPQTLVLCSPGEFSLSYRNRVFNHCMSAQCHPEPWEAAPHCYFIVALTLLAGLFLKGQWSPLHKGCFLTCVVQKYAGTSPRGPLMSGGNGTDFRVSQMCS